MLSNMLNRFQFVNLIFFMISKKRTLKFKLKFFFINRSRLNLDHRMMIKFFVRFFRKRNCLKQILK